MPDIKAGKLEDSGISQIKSGESRISKDHWDKCAKKCKGESNVIAKLKITDSRKAPEKAKAKTTKKSA
ncbi:hypothetical protein [Methanothrix sp.]|uniref:hypothetical protein n=1 Tax=Methanothrix sp. TaxID=90426 RepID=UPI0032AEA290